LGFRREGEEEDGVDALGCGVQKRSRRKKWCRCFRVWVSEGKCNNEMHI
jgi:hypothetical protein